MKGGLVQLHQLDDTFGSTYSRRLAPLLTDPARKRTGRFTLELDSLAFGVTGSRGLGDRTGYENSRETRVNQVDSLTTTLRGRVALTWDDRIGSVSGFAEGAFGGSTIADIDEPIELEDDLEFGAETQLRIVSIAAPKGRIPLSFFVQGAFDTEFTAGLDEAGAKLPLQRIVRGTAGTTFGRYLMLKELKAGLFLEYDLGAEVGPLAPGGAVSAKTERVWGPVRWANLLDFKGYFPTPVDTDEDLAFTLQLRTDLGIVPLKRLIPGLSVGAFADMLLFQGKVDTNDGVRAHLLLGAALTYDADLRPPVRLR